MHPPEEEKQEEGIKRFFRESLGSWIAVGLATLRGFLYHIAQGVKGALSRFQRALSSTIFRWKHSLIMSFPLPAELKWQEILDCMAILTHGYYEETEKTFGDSIATKLLCKTMFNTGKRWIRSHAKAQMKNRPGREYYANVLTSAFKMLDIRSTVEISKNTIVVTNTACPYLEWGRKQGIPSEKICSAFCGDPESFFSGISYGLPYYVRYKPIHMMGCGDPECKKEFSGTSTRKPQHPIPLAEHDSPQEDVLRSVSADLSTSDGF
ncbi:MAG: hypothetical protein HYX82_02000 [Chloroflexi bacterium]|nr:hypothetical protein [Chloroflexota bacterium]